jgi:hypothetical protein
MKSLLPTLFVILAIALFFIVVNPLLGDVSQLKTDVATYNTALDNSTSLQKTQDALIEKYKNISQEDKDRLEHFLPNTINNIKLILEIEQMANLHNMQIKDIKFDTQQQKSTTDVNTIGDTSTLSSDTKSVPYGTFPIEFTTDGDYSTFILFLKDIEHNLRLIDVQSVSFSVPDATLKTPGVDPNIYSYTLKVETYWLK